MLVRSVVCFGGSLLAPSALALLGPLPSGHAAAQGMQFVDVATELGLSVQLSNGGPGCAVGDYDGDGWMDISVCGSSDPRPRIFRNRGAELAAGQGGPHFVEVTDQVLPPTTVPSSLAMFVDLDDDHDHDLLVVRRFMHPMTGQWDPDRTGLMVYENRGGVFVDLETPEELGFFPRRNGGLALADCDGDGDLDIVFTHSAPAVLGGGSPGFYIRNDGIANLVDATAEFGAGLGMPRRYFSAVLADFNLDLKPDLHVACDGQPDFHCHQVAPGVYFDVTHMVGANNVGSDMGLAVGDIDNDGDLDIFSTNIDQGILYVNDGQGHFTEEGFARGVGSWPQTPIGWGTAFVDFDHDGDQDLVLVAAQHPGVLFENDGQGYFTNVTAGSGLDLLGHGLLSFDFDRDGDQDLLTWRSGNSPLRLWENRSSALEDRHWLIVRPIGRRSNADGVGVIVKVEAGGIEQTRVILAGYSFKAGPPMEAHFGLGTAAVAERVTVTWPTSGRTQVLEGVAADQELVVLERGAQ